MDVVGRFYVIEAKKVLVDPPNDIFINYFLFLRQLKQCVPSEWNLEQQDRLLWLHVQVETSLLDGNTLM